MTWTLTIPEVPPTENQQRRSTRQDARRRKLTVWRSKLIPQPITTEEPRA